MEAHPVVVMPAGELLEIGDRCGSGILAQFDHDALGLLLLLHLHQHDGNLRSGSGGAWSGRASPQECGKNDRQKE
jgi:hypothetical protein